MIEMDVGNQRDTDSLDLPDGGCRLLIGNRNADDFTAASSSRDLLEGGRDIARIGGGHGLDRHGGIAADLHPSRIWRVFFFLMVAGSLMKSSV